MNTKTNFDFSYRSIVKTVKIMSFFLVIIFGAAANAQAAGVTLTATPASSAVSVGQSASYTIKINRDGYADKVTLTATNLPAGVTATFTPNTTTALSSTLKLQTATSTPVGTFNITIKATANAITIAPIIVKLTTNAMPSISISVTPAEMGIVAGQTAAFDVAINRRNFDGAVTLSAEEVPLGMTVVFEPQTTSGNSTRMYLYSGGMPFEEDSVGLNVVASAFGNPSVPRGFTRLKIEINCGLSWVEQFGVSHPQGGGACYDSATGTFAGCPDFATDVAVDAGGNVYLAGDTNTFDGSNPARNSWIAKYTATGSRLWLRHITDSRESYATDVIADGAGNVYVAGYALVNSPTFVNYDLFIKKYDGNGNLLGTHSLGTVHEDGTGGIHLAFDVSGNLLMTAATNIQRTLIERAGDTYDVNYDVTRYTFNANFNLPVSTVLVSGSNGNPLDLAVGEDGGVRVAGNYMSNTYRTGWVQSFGAQAWRSNADFGLGFFPKKIVVDRNGNVFIANSDRILKLNAATGNLAWRQIEGGTTTTVNTLAVDGSGDVYYAGKTYGSIAAINPNAGNPNIPNSPARSDAFWGKRSGADGRSLLIRQFAVADKDSFSSIKIGNNNDLYFAGNTVFFKNVNYRFEDAMVMRYAVKNCIVPRF